MGETALLLKWSRFDSLTMDFEMHSFSSSLSFLRYFTGNILIINPKETNMKLERTYKEGELF